MKLVELTEHVAETVTSSLSLYLALEASSPLVWNVAGVEGFSVSEKLIR
jgi:hypothetical protein